MFIYLHIYICIRICTYIYISIYPPDAMNHVKIFEGQPRRCALWELAPKWYKTFPPDHIDQVEIYNSSLLSNHASNA